MDLFIQLYTYNLYKQLLKDYAFLNVLFNVTLQNQYTIIQMCHIHMKFY